MCQECKLDSGALLEHNRQLEHENTRLRGAVQRAICGHVLDGTKSCQLPWNHEGTHAWSSTADGEVVVRWD